MTENEYTMDELIDFMYNVMDDSDEEAIPFVKEVIQALEEIQQYRAIGTVEGYEKAIQATTEYYLLMKEYKSKVQDFETIVTIEEFKALKEKNVEIEITEPQGNKIVAGIMLPKVKGKAVVSLSDLHDILMDVGGTNIRDKVFEQIYNRDIIIGLRDVIEKWEERRKYESNRNR